ncbi:MAG: hypothetical protein NTV88_00140 [Candidatus Micrarchaeota archaeon]|nr:hypothetical protein [Candidatus Micrarchaeota archaeon]
MPSASFRVHDKWKELMVKEIFKSHGKMLSQFFHPNVKMIGGRVGGTLDASTLYELAELQHAKWGAKDGNTKTVESYMMDLVRKKGPTPIFVYFNDSGHVEGAVFPVQVGNRHVTTWQNAVDNDSAIGDDVACPKICTYGNVEGVAKALITEGVLPYATVLAYFRVVFDLIAYSRPANYGPEKRGIGILEHLPTDPNWAKFHFRNDGRLICVVKDAVSALDEKAGGYGFIVGYTKHLNPSEQMLVALKAIEKDVKWML